MYSSIYSFKLKIEVKNRKKKFWVINVRNESYLKTAMETFTKKFQSGTFFNLNLHFHYR